MLWKQQVTNLDSSQSMAHNKVYLFYNKLLTFTKLTVVHCIFVIYISQRLSVLLITTYYCIQETA